MGIIALKNVSKRYGQQTVVENFDLDMADGEFIVLVGPSGCGKSTTLRMIAGLEEVSEGQIFIAGKEVTNLQPGERNIAMVFQNYALYPHKSVYENLAFGLRMRKTPAAEILTKVQWAAEMLNIENLLERKPRQLSGGQMQRVSLGRALVRSPEAFLLDEPLSNLDAKLRVRMREELAQLHKRVGTNMVYVTHDQVEAMTLGDRIVIMNQGKIQQVGKPLDVYDNPANIFVAGFIGAPEMNQIPGELIYSDGALRFIYQSINLKIETKKAPKVLNHQKVILGIRPEHVSLTDNGSSAVNASVLLVEQMGANTLTVYKLVDSPKDIKLRVLSGRQTHTHEEAVDRLYLDLRHIHIFDAETGINLA
jgi:multiple sugar transport system ATP-binding protein